MSGLNRGNGYMLGKANKNNSELKEGVFLNEYSNKWMVVVKNKSISKGARPVIVHSQHKLKIDAENKYNSLKNVRL